MENLFKMNLWRALGACLLVCLVTIVWAANRKADSSLQRARTPEAVYTAYLEQVGELYKLLAERNDDEAVDREAILHELTDETISLYDQLPEEMSEKEKTAILKAHYGGILEEAGQIAKQ